MPEPKNPLTSAPPSRQILLAADKEELVTRIEALQVDLQRRMDVEEEILHLNLQKGTASLQAQVEEASRRFKVAQQELDAFRLEILQAEGDPSGQAARPYIYEDLSAPPQEGPDRSQLRSLLAVFRRLRDERDRLKQETGQTSQAMAALQSEAQAATLRAEKSGAEISTMAVTIADFEVSQGRLKQEALAAQAEADAQRLRAEQAASEAAVKVAAMTELEAAQARLRRDLEEAAAEAAQLRMELGRQPRPAQGETAGDRAERAQLEDERDRLEQEKADARAEAERLRLELDQARDAQAESADEAAGLRAAGVDLDAEVERHKGEIARLESHLAEQVEEQAGLGRKIAYEQAKSEGLAAEKLQLLQRLAESNRLLEEARFELDHPEQSAGFDQLEKFLSKARLRPLLDKSVGGPSAELLVEAVGAVIGAQETPLAAVRDLRPRINRPPRAPGLGELRQFIEWLRQSDVDGVKRVHDALRQSFFPLAKGQDAVVVDVDAPELVLGRRPQPDQSYWPLVMFAPELQEFWHGELRTGPELAPREIVEFVSEGISRAPAALDRSRLRLRMDSRFYGDALLRLLEAKKCSYVVAPPNSAELRAAARRCAFEGLSEGWEAGEWIPKARSSRTPSPRFVALRHLRSAQPTPALPFLFRDPQYSYTVLGVDRKITARQALDAFAARGASEEREHALLRDFSVNRLLARGSESHAKFLPLFLLCADLAQWFRRSSR